jgi:small GTP-binding protein
MSNEIDYTLKLLIIGDTNVGKTSFFNKIQNNSAYFSESTIGVDFTKMYYTIRDKHVKIIVWDTAGQERFRTLTTGFYKKADGIVICFDVTSEKTFDGIKDWVE